MDTSSWLLGFIGGCLIGGGSLLAMIVSKKVPGVSGIFGRLLLPSCNDRTWRLFFLAGLLGGAGLLFFLSDAAATYRIPVGRSLLVFAIAGLVVGFGTRLGGGCTSGHGVCGTGMGAKDSVIATIVFMGAGFLTVFLFHLIATGA